MTRDAPKFDELPLFAPDDAIADAFMGPGKTTEWRQIAALLEGRGLPKIDALMGGRYVPAVRAFFDKEYGLIEKAPRLAPSGVENLGAWKQEKPKVRRLRQV
jgi:hypothetical protein